MTRPGRRADTTRGRGRAGAGQGLVEFTVVLPILLILLAAMMEFGFAFSDRLTIGNATREGARIGGALVTGSDTTCTGDPAGVDNTIIASVQNILKSGGSDVDLSRISEIRIYKSNSSGAQSGGNANIWHYTPGSGPDADPDTGTEILDFSPASTGWAACTRQNGGTPDSMGVRVTYSYHLRTPLGAFLRLVGGDFASTITLVDATIMALNPTT